MSGQYQDMDIDFFSLAVFSHRVYVHVFSYQPVKTKTYSFIKQVFVLGIHLKANK